MSVNQHVQNHIYIHLYNVIIIHHTNLIRRIIMLGSPNLCVWLCVSVCANEIFPIECSQLRCTRCIWWYCAAYRVKSHREIYYLRNVEDNWHFYSTIIMISFCLVSGTCCLKCLDGKWRVCWIHIVWNHTIIDSSKRQKNDVQLLIALSKTVSKSLMNISFHKQWA